MDIADIRTGIYNHLCTQVTAVSNRVYWAYSAPADTTLPCLIMSMGEDMASINSPKGMFSQVHVSALGKEGSIHLLDPVVDAVVKALHKVAITTPDGRKIYPEYRRDSRFEAWDEDFKANVITVSFVIPTDFWT